MKTVSIVKFSILVVFTLFTSCELPGGAQKAQATPDKQEQTKSQKEQAAPKQEQPNGEKALDNVKADWLEYEPAVVELEGKLIIKTFFGPPNFGEEPETDFKEETRILSLDRPVNVRSRDETDSVLGPPIKNVRELQLVFDGPLKQWVGKKLGVKGSLFHAHTGHHHTDVLLNVESISLAPLN
jgi:hypothetical protein